MTTSRQDRTMAMIPLTTAEQVLEAYHGLAVSYDFQIGALVQFKAGLASANIPRPGEPGVITEIVPGRRDKNDDAAAVTLGIIVPGGGMQFYTADIRRFEPFVAAPAALRLVREDEDESPATSQEA